MLGGCRSSLETGVRRDGWHTLADTLGALNISVLSVWFFVFFFVGGAGCILLRLGHLNNYNKYSLCIAYEKCCSPVKEWWEAGALRVSKEMLCHGLLTVVIF